MLLWLAEYLTEYYSGFNVFQYITMRTILGALTSLFIGLLVGPSLIANLSKLQIGQSVREDGPESHLSKAGTPTMGGMLILVSIAFSTLCWADLSNRYILVVSLVTLFFGFIGCIKMRPLNQAIQRLIRNALMRATTSCKNFSVWL